MLFYRNILRQPLISRACQSSEIGLFTQGTFSQFQRRAFFDSLLKSSIGDCPLRTLNHTKIIPYPSTTVFKAVADVSGYPTFLPFTISSQVVTRDEKGYPTEAKLKIGYEKFGLEETWDSIVNCNPEEGTVEAKSSKLGSSGLFESLQTKWHIRDHSDGESLVNLRVDVKFQNLVYDQMFAQVEGKVASTMISAFEKRVKEIEGG